METRARSLIKAVLWQVVGLVTMTLVGLALTGSAAVGGAIALANCVVGFVCYVIYERLWVHVRWGRLHG
ncbi:DUF2061 domain-containing protein [Rhodosalinus sp.]|uniref:DUF2061 domain-containing protein n=1 Tax=Rhodosalinus sp. TaxID=2047741 RepID=UPI003564DADF